MVGSAITAGIGLSLMGLALLFLLFIFQERSRRGSLSLADQIYYKQRDVRRVICSLLLVLIGVLMIVASQVDVRESGYHVVLWTVSWLVVLALLAVVIMLASMDWFANRHFATRHRRELQQEQREILADLARKRISESQTNASLRNHPRFQDPSTN